MWLLRHPPIKLLNSLLLLMYLLLFLGELHIRSLLQLTLSVTKGFMCHKHMRKLPLLSLLYSRQGNVCDECSLTCKLICLFVKNVFLCSMV